MTLRKELQEEEFNKVEFESGEVESLIFPQQFLLVSTVLLEPFPATDKTFFLLFKSLLVLH